MDLATPADGLVAAGTRVALTGARGFIGAPLRAALVGLGAEVCAFTSDQPILRPDGSLPPELPGSRVVLHFATSVTPRSAERHPERVSADRDRFIRLLDRLAELDRPPLVGLASSGGYVYDPQARLPFQEGSPLRPQTAYGKAKRQLERELADRRDAVPGIALRLASVYGPGQPTGTGHGVIAHWLEAAARGEPLRLFGEPSTLRDFVYIDDVVEAMCRVVALACAPLPAAVNIGSGEATSLDRLLRILVCLVTGNAAVERTGNRGFDRYDAQLDIRCARSALGWAPRTALETGLVRVWRGLAKK
jgi:UDP-glucose 4-epimerase